jgi:hypothetical protein
MCVGFNSKRFSPALDYKYIHVGDSMDNLIILFKTLY